MVKRRIVIGHLYPKQMNVYGDMGNVITLKYRLEARGIAVEYKPIDSIAELKDNKVDILIGGGGQDSNQDVVQADLIKHRQILRDLAEADTVMLMICGLYQLFGHRFIVSEDHVIKGIGIFDLETRASENRLIGNVVVDSPFGRLVGFENHSGRTTLGSEVKPLGTVIRGAGNNGETNDEGAVYKNVFGSYLHGPCLVKNPQFADELIKRALGNNDLALLDDRLELKAAEVARKRPY